MITSKLLLSRERNFVVTLVKVSYHYIILFYWRLLHLERNFMRSHTDDWYLISMSHKIPFHVQKSATKQYFVEIFDKCNSIHCSRQLIDIAVINFPHNAFPYIAVQHNINFGANKLAKLLSVFMSLDNHQSS